MSSGTFWVVFVIACIAGVANGVRIGVNRNKDK